MYYAIINKSYIKFHLFIFYREEYLDNLPQLLTAIVKNIPLIAERSNENIV